MARSIRITKRHRAIAQAIVDLDDRYGHMPYNNSGQTVRGVLNLSIPLAHLVRAEIVTCVADEFCLIDENALDEVYTLVRLAYERYAESTRRSA